MSEKITYDNPITPESIIDKIAQKHMEQDRRVAVMKEEIEDFKAALNRLASSDDGRYVLRKLIRYCGIFTFDKVLNPAKLVEDRGRQGVYLELIRPFLAPEVLSELERN